MTAEAAAAMLGTSTRILSLWEKRFGYPAPVRAADGQWMYPDEEMISLRDALARELSIASAITRTRRVHVNRAAHGRRLAPPHSPQEAR